MSFRTVCAALLLVSAAQQAVAQPAPQAPDQERAAAEAKFKAIEQNLHPQTGTVTVPAAHARLQLGNAYYYLPADEAKTVLTQAWGNPPDQVSNVLGMVFPAGKTFHDATWGAVIQYEDTGHVSDKDAASQDYNAVLDQMKSGEDADNKAARDQGYPGSHLLGWAQPPTYDAASRTLIWARNIKFDNAPGNTLNYDVRTLGRTGVLSLNMIDSMENLPQVRDAARGLGSTITFDSGSAYGDFNPSSDKLADYGLAGLVAAGAGLAVAKKAGLLAIVLIFLKKGLVIVAIAAAALWRKVKRLFGKGGDEESEVAAELPPAE